MSAATAYQEKFPGADVDLEAILETSSGVESGAAVKELEKLLTTIFPAHMAGSDAAGRDWVKICKVLSDKLPRALVEDKHYYPQFLTPEEAEALKVCLVAERPPYLVKYKECWRTEVISRPKCNMAEPVDGKWPAYKWGQVKDDLPLIELPPPLVQKLARRLEAHFGHPRGFLNGPMATYYFDGKNQYLVNHQDKSHSCESTGQIESAAPIYNLSLGAPRNFVIADLNSLGKTKRADMQIYVDIRMLSGDLVVLSPRMNMELCHGVPEDPEAPAGLRISLVFRHCTKYWMRQLHDNAWELCQRSASGKDGPWKPLPSSKDGEVDDIEARLLGRRQHAAARILEKQLKPKRGRASGTGQRAAAANSSGPQPSATRKRPASGSSNQKRRKLAPHQPEENEGDEAEPEPCKIGSPAPAQIPGAPAKLTRNSATAGEATAERERPSMGAGETVRALEAGDTVKVLTGPWAGEVRIVSGAKADSYEVDEQWFERSQLEFQF